MRCAAIALAFAMFTFSAVAQEPPTVTVSGAVQHPLTLTIADLRAMPARDVTTW